jgi:hypothetical protein
MEQHLLLRTGRLFALPSFLEGVGSLVDLRGSFDRYNEAESPEEADRAAIRSDWLAIADDFREAMTRVREEILAAEQEE